VTGERTPGGPVADVPRVLILADHLGYPGGITHGCTSYFLNILPALRRAGADLTACFLRDPHPAAQRLREQGIAPIFLSRHPYSPLAVNDVVRIVRARNIGLIHAAGIKATLVARMAALPTGAQVVIHLHDLIYPQPWLSLLHFCFARRRDWGIGVSAAVLPVAEHGYHLHPERFSVIHNGIPVAQFRAAASQAKNIRQELSIAEGRKVIAVVGRMYPIKGHVRMLHMLKRIVARCPEALLLVVGDGPEREPCERLTDELHLREHVRFLGTRHDVPALLKAADLLVIPSDSEGLSLAAIEAHAIGKPVVSFAVGGMPELVVDQVNGRLIDPQDSAGFIDAVVDLLMDDDRRKAMGEQGLLSVERFSLDASITALIECYRAAMVPSISAQSVMHT
jgi:glycosyltransferase involved in cell wall biosynthesis